MAEHNTRELILTAAVDIMAKKGKDASIADIASAAGVNVSNIYHYFKNKEDLLFHTAGAYMKDRLPKYEERLLGIREPVSLLTKQIWEQLNYHKENPNYAKFTLFECRSRKNFFRHEAFGYFFRWSKILKAVLKEGQQKGIFSPDVSITVARDMIQGLMDIENILYYAGKRSQSPLEDFDDIVHIVLPMISAYPSAKSEPVGKQASIIDTAEQLFAEKSYAKSTTLEIAKASGLAERTLYEYFDNKEDILFTTLQQRLQGQVRSIHELFQVTTPLRKLRLFTYYYFTVYLRQPAFVKTFILDGIFNPNFYQSKAYEDFESLAGIIDQIIDEGKADGSIAETFNNRIFRNMYLGIFSHTMLRWYFSDETKVQIDMAGWIHEVTNLLIRAIVRAGYTKPISDPMLAAVVNGTTTPL